MRGVVGVGVLAVLAAVPATAGAVSFTAPTTFDAGEAPSSLAIADFNPATDPYPAVANRDSGDVSVLLGEGGGGFGPKADFDAGDGPQSVAVGDFDGDGNADLAVANAASDDVSVLLGDGNGGFSGPTSVAAGNEPIAIVVADFNSDEDSDPDLAVVHGASNHVAVLLGNGDGSFSGPEIILAADKPTSIAVGNFNLDLDPDLAVSAGPGDDVDEKVWVALGGTGGSFSDPMKNDVEHAGALAVGDFDEDAVPDLAVGPGPSILLGNGDGSFSDPTASGIGDDSLAVGEFNGDDDPDLVVEANVGADIRVALGEAGAGFSAPTEFPTAGTGRASIAVEDFDADSDADIAVANNGTDHVSVLLNAPEPPTLNDTDPDSPANDNSPSVKGAAEAGTTVDLYTSADCSGHPAATGSAEAFASPGLDVSVPDNTSTTFRATATDAGDTSPCSTSSLTYVEDSNPPVAAVALSPNPVLTGDAVSFDASGSTGLGIVRYEWDLDGNGSFETDTGGDPSASRSYSAAEDITTAVRVTDQAGLTDVATAPLAIRLRPPPGELGVSINGGDQFTNDPHVKVSAVWPTFAHTLVLSNDGGFADPGHFAVAAETQWTLDSSGPERLPKTIYARFAGGESGRETYQDDIILDETAPRILSVTATRRGGGSARAAVQAAKAKKRTYRLRIRARDKTSGVEMMQVSGKKRRPGELREFRKRLGYKSRSRRIFVRVQDAAGNLSRWEKVRHR